MGMPSGARVDMGVTAIHHLQYFQVYHVTAEIQRDIDFGASAPIIPS
jgi:hypothetical protein